MLICRICGLRFPVHADHEFETHVGRCWKRNEDIVAEHRPNVLVFGDPELAAFARAEGDVYNRRPGTRRRPR